jgi:Cys-tRNA synthase (O-phospho-L-seryl-tRNA:Cys-tRNA synthase)
MEPYYGNVDPVEEVGKIAKEYDILYMVNPAYTTGVPSKGNLNNLIGMIQRESSREEESGRRS